MSILRKIKERAKKRALRVRRKIAAGDKPRVSVFRSLNNIYAQIIDDNSHATLVSCSSLDFKDVKGDKKAIANQVGKELAKRAKEKGLTEATFDRGRFLYHGRVKALAEGLREGGLKI